MKNVTKMDAPIIQNNEYQGQSISIIKQLHVITVSIHCAPEMSEIDCIGRIESFWPKFVMGW